MNNWIETSGSPFVIVEQQYAHQWKGQENYNAICSVTDYLGKIYIDNHVLLVMGDEPMATRIVNKDGAILIIRWKYAPDYLTVEKLLENDIVTGAEPIEEVEVKAADGQENTENAEISTPVNAPKVTSIRVETYGIDYGMPETLTPFDYTSWMYKQYGIGQ